MNLDPAAFIAILAMAIATMATRLAGLIVPRNFAARGRMKRAFEAVPPAVLAALAAPAALTGGPADAVAAAAAGLAAFARLPILAVVAIGVAVAAIGRHIAG